MADPTTTALAPYDPRSNQHAFEPRDTAEALVLAKQLHASGLMPRALGKPEAVLTAIIMGREYGFSAMQSVRMIHVIEGKPSLSADAMAGLVKSDARCEWFVLVESSPTIATYETQRRGEPRSTKLSFTIDEAKAAGLLGKDNWRKFPAAMLRARCIAALARAVYPDVLAGAYDPDEIERQDDRPRGTVTVMPSAAPSEPSSPASEVVEGQFREVPPTAPAPQAAPATSTPAGPDEEQLLRDMIAGSESLADLAVTSAQLTKAKPRLSHDAQRRLGADYKAQKAHLESQAPPQGDEPPHDADAQAASAPEQAGSAA